MTPLPSTIVVVCEANQARSPLAKALLTRALADRKVNDIVVATAGVRVARDGDIAAEQALVVGQMNGLDLTSHRTRKLTAAMVGAATIVLTMTEAQRRAVGRLVPAASPRTFTLLELDRLLSGAPGLPTGCPELAVLAHRRRPHVPPASRPEDIADPIGHPRRHWMSLYDRLDRTVRRLAESLDATR